MVAVANSSCPASSARLYSAHSSMSCFLLSCAISAIRRRRIALAGRWSCRSSRSFRQAGDQGGAACGQDAADLRGLLIAVAIKDRVQVVQVAGRRVAGQGRAPRGGPRGGRPGRRPGAARVPRNRPRISASRWGFCVEGAYCSWAGVGGGRSVDGPAGARPLLLGQVIASSRRRTSVAANGPPCPT